MACPSAPFPGLAKDSPGHQFALSQLIMYPIFLVVAVGVFYSQRTTTLFLRKRSLRLLLAGALGSMIPYAAFAVYPYIQSQNFPCALYVCLVYLSNPAICIPLTLKIAQYQNAVSYMRLRTRLQNERRESLATDEVIVGFDPLGGEMSFSTLVGHLRLVFCFSRTQHDRILHAKFARSIGYSILWISLSALPFVIAFCTRLILNPHWVSCTGCEIEVADAAILIAINLFALILCTFANPTFCIRASRRDALRIVQEVMWTWFIGSVFANLGFILFIVDPGDVYKRGIFDFKWFLLVTTCIFIYMQTFHQIYISRNIRRHILLSPYLNQVERLGVVLADKRLRAFLESFMDSELSPEVLRFMSAVDKYKKKFSENNPTVRRRAEDILNEFVRVGSPLEINIGSKVRDTLLKLAQQGSYSVTLFDSAYAEIRQALLLDGFARFLEDMEDNIHIEKVSLQPVSDHPDVIDEEDPAMSS